ncbi:DUF222 domain-containing protein [Nocardiopsis sediminis]|uniref:DUF222 domain-containing protein n=1 Tax=Nocardiopsis sediminis TaxID=1778267 RepID=A0ABV8FML6_9ACTN
MSTPPTTALREEVTPDDPPPVLAGGLMPEWMLTLDTATLTGDEQLDLIVRAEQAKRWLEAFQLDAMATFTRTRKREAPAPLQVSAEEDAAAEIGCELGIPPGLAGARLAHAQRLGETFPALHDALLTGQVDEYRTRVVADAAPEDWDPATTAAYATRMLAKMGDKSGRALMNLAKKTVAELDPAKAEERKARTIANRQLRIYDGGPQQAGTGSVEITDIDATDALAVEQRIAAIARALRADTPGAQNTDYWTKTVTQDQIRADIAVGLLLGRLPLTLGLEIPADAAEHGITDTHAEQAGDAPATARCAACGRTPGQAQGEDQDRGRGQVVIPGMAAPNPAPFSPVGKLHVIIPLSALPTEMGGSESRSLGEIPGHGPILAEAARDLAKGATSKATRWCYTVVDEDGNPVADGTTAYRPPPLLRSHIDSRDRTCRFPHCNRPAVECDADHTMPHHLGGSTSAGNLAALCRRHHRLKQTPGWNLSQPSPGTLVWRTPHNRTHTTTRDPYPSQ